MLDSPSSSRWRAFRATLYCTFPGKPALFQALIEAYSLWQPIAFQLLIGPVFVHIATRPLAAMLGPDRRGLVAGDGAAHAAAMKVRSTDPRAHEVAHWIAQLDCAAAQRLCA